MRICPHPASTYKSGVRVWKENGEQGAGKGAGRFPKSKSKSKSSRLMFMQSNGGLADAQVFSRQTVFCQDQLAALIIKPAWWLGLTNYHDMVAPPVVAHYGEYGRLLKPDCWVRLHERRWWRFTLIAAGGRFRYANWWGALSRGSRSRLGAVKSGPASFYSKGPLTVTGAMWW